MDFQKIAGVIPAHLASARFPEKILFSFFGHPMIEHVRRRALLAEGLDEVYVATCDVEIADAVISYGGQVIMTGRHHQNGTTRVAEAAAEIDCSHVLLLQGDEPLLLPDYVDAMVSTIRANPGGDAWNGTALLNDTDELDRRSFVKCAIGQKQQILSCFRRGPSFADFSKQQKYIQKILGIIGYRRDFLLQLVDLKATPIELNDLIEQMRIVEHGFTLQAVPLGIALPSVNEPGEAQLINDCLQTDAEQSRLLRQIFPS